MTDQTETIAVNKIWSLSLNAILSVSAFSVPFLISGPQFLTGSMVNTLLYIASARQIKLKNLYLLSLLPSLGAISHGMLFGPFTPYLLFFIPSIWLGNMILILSFSKLKTIFAFPFNIFLASIFKTCVLYVTAFVFTEIRLVPQVFIKSMGIIQLLTAVTGGMLAYSLFWIAKRKI